MSPEVEVPTRRVWILRHAKAAADSPEGDDHSRPLTKRGRRQAEAACRFLSDARAAGKPAPRLVLCSSAARALQTAELVVPALGEDVELQVERALYTADPDDVMEMLRRLEDAVSAVMVVGHNPTFGELALWLVSHDDPGRAGLDQYPTCALAQIAQPLPTWSGLVPGSGALEELFVPER